MCVHSYLELEAYSARDTLFTVVHIKRTWQIIIPCSHSIIMQLIV